MEHPKSPMLQSTKLWAPTWCYKRKVPHHEILFHAQTLYCIKLPSGYMVSMKHKWISCLVLSPIPRCSLIQAKNLKLLLQVFWIRDTQPVQILDMLLPQEAKGGWQTMEWFWWEPGYSGEIKRRGRLIGRMGRAEKSYRRDVWTKKRILFFRQME